MADSSYASVAAFRIFRDTLVTQVVDFLVSKGEDRKVMEKYVRKTFTRWWFENALYDQIDSFLPTEEFALNTDYLEGGSTGLQLSSLEKKQLQGMVIRAYRKMQEEMPALKRKQYEGQIVGATKYEAIVKDGGKVVSKAPLSGYQLTSMYLRLDPKMRGQAANLIILEAVRLHELGSQNEHLSIPPSVLGYLSMQMELFGTPMNTTLSSFCSPFPDIEKFFGSKGNFLTYDLQPGFSYLFNPPFDEELMAVSASRLVSEMERLKEEDVKVLCLLPVWDAPTQRKLGMPVYTEAPFRALEVLLASQFVRDRTELSREGYPYFNYFSESFVPASATHMIILSTGDLPPEWDISRISNLWQSSTK